MVRVSRPGGYTRTQIVHERRTNANGTFELGTGASGLEPFPKFMNTPVRLL